MLQILLSRVILCAVDLANYTVEMAILVGKQAKHEDDMRVTDVTTHTVCHQHSVTSSLISLTSSVTLIKQAPSPLTPHPLSIELACSARHVTATVEMAAVEVEIVAVVVAAATVAVATVVAVAAVVERLDADDGSNSGMD